MDAAAALEATALAQFLKRSVWIYPLVNTAHILGLALLIGAVIPMDLRILGWTRHGGLEETVALLRPFAIAGLVLAMASGALLFLTQAGDYAANGWFRGKMALVGAAVLNALIHLRLTGMAVHRQRVAALASLTLWPAVLLCGRMIAYS